MPAPPTGSGRWPTSAWQQLLRLTIEMMDSLPTAPGWSFGGGTALAVQLSHRISFDIDIFVPSSDIIRDLSPYRNPTVKRLLAGRPYQYPGNYLKFQMDDGEIDIIGAGPRTDDPWRNWSFEGRTLRLETPCEIGLKKMFFRPSGFKIRDIFDLAAIIDATPHELAANMGEVADRLPRLIDRVRLLAPSYATAVTTDIAMTDQGRPYGTAEIPERVLGFLHRFV